MTPAAVVPSSSPVAGQMRRLDQRRHHAKLFPGSRLKAFSKSRFARNRKFPSYRQRCLLLAQADMRARLVRAVAQVEIGSKDKTNGRPSAEVLSLMPE